jgi:hypothetical protein
VGGGGRASRRLTPRVGTQFTCFTRTKKVQVLTRKMWWHARSCMSLQVVGGLWADELPPCTPAATAATSAAASAATSDLAPTNTSTAYVIASAPWARAAAPPLQCPACPQRHVRASVRQLAAAEAGGGGGSRTGEGGGGLQLWHYGVAFTATRKGQYSVVTSLVGPQGLMATYYALSRSAQEQGKDAFSSETPWATGHSTVSLVAAQVWDLNVNWPLDRSARYGACWRFLAYADAC